MLLVLKIQPNPSGITPEGLRVVKRAKGETTHYVFQGMEPIFEKKIVAGKSKSYVYAFGKYLARVDGVIEDAEAQQYFYHTDHLGSIRVVTDQAGKVVYNADYFTFGSRYTMDDDFEELHGFTGKEYDPDIGLYYFNARWYDPDLGRFISEDPARDPNNPNLYSYCGNNPIMRVDPTGKFWWIVVSAILGGLDSYLCGGDFMQGFVMGAITGAIGAGVSSFVSSAWGSALKTFGTQVVSGAIAGGITGELFGEGFGKGAVYGAIGGAINFGVDKRYGDFASKSTFNKVIVNGLKGGLNGLARGGDFIEGFAYGFANEFGSSLFDSSTMDGVGGTQEDIPDGDYQILMNGLDYYRSLYKQLEEQLAATTDPSAQLEINQQMNACLQMILRITNQTKLIWPTTGIITSRFTLWRESKNPKIYKSGPHRAMDIANKVGTPIVAIANGVVTKIDDTKISGNIIEIDYGNGVTSSFHHLNGYADNISVGTQVSQGQVVAYMGNTGDATTGPHLHFELRINGQLVNPEDYLPKW